MSEDSSIRHEAKILEVRNEFAERGFTVITEPADNQMPFQLFGYSPDLLVTKDGGGYVIEVKTKTSRLSFDKLQRIAEEVASHDGWRFLLITLEDLPSSEIPASLDELPSWDELAEKIEQALGLLNVGPTEAIVMYLWAIFEVAMRRRAMEINLPAERLQVSRLLKLLYSSGEISVNQIEDAERFMKLRNECAHAFIRNVAKESVSVYLELVTKLVSEWRGAALRA